MKDPLPLPAIATALGGPVDPFRGLVARPLARWQKIVYGLLAAMLVLLGLIGLVLPVLPGLALLALAAGMLARVWPGFGRWWFKRPLVQRFTRKQQQLKNAWRRWFRRGLTVMTRVKYRLLSLGWTRLAGLTGIVDQIRGVLVHRFVRR